MIQAIVDVLWGVLLFAGIIILTALVGVAVGKFVIWLLSKEEP